VKSVLLAIIRTNITVFWNVTPCRLVANRGSEEFAISIFKGSYLRPIFTLPLWNGSSGFLRYVLTLPNYTASQPEDDTVKR